MSSLDFIIDFPEEPIDTNSPKRNFNTPKRTYSYRNVVDWNQNEADNNLRCGRCRADFRKTVDCGETCFFCKRKVCQSCREYCDPSTNWICTICYDFMKVDKQKYDQNSNVFVPTTKQINNSIFKSWTICGPRRKLVQNFHRNIQYKSLPIKFKNYENLKDFERNSNKKHVENSFRKNIFTENCDKNSIEMFDYEFSKKLQPLDGDDYKLVFLNSDSLLKEDCDVNSDYDMDHDDIDEVFDDAKSIISSSESRKSVSLDDCDWDYFETFSVHNYNFNYYNYNHSNLLKSHQCVKKIVNSDQYAVISKKLKLNDNLNSNSSYQCHSCGSMNIQLVPVPVPVPVPITAVAEHLEKTEYLQFLKRILEKSDPSLIKNLCIESNQFFHGKLEPEPEVKPETEIEASSQTCDDLQFSRDNDTELRTNSESSSSSTSSLSGEIDKSNCDEKNTKKKFIKVYEINTTENRDENEETESAVDNDDLISLSSSGNRNNNCFIELKSIKLLNNEEKIDSKLPSKSTLEKVVQSQQISTVVKVGCNEDCSNDNAQLRITHVESEQIVDSTAVFPETYGRHNDYSVMITANEQQVSDNVTNRLHTRTTNLLICSDDTENSNDDNDNDNDDDDISVKSVEELFDFSPKNVLHFDNKVVCSDKRKQVVVKKCQYVANNEDSGAVEGFLEDGLADDDSWVEEISVHNEADDDDNNDKDHDDEEDKDEEKLLVEDCTEYSYRRSSLDFPLHTIVEESCEESETECSIKKSSQLQISKPSEAPNSSSDFTDLERYFFFGLSDENAINSSSEASSVYSEDLNNTSKNKPDEFNELVASKLEKYFHNSPSLETLVENRKDSDGGSVGSDSEGKPSPDQKRSKKLMKAKDLSKFHSNSADSVLNEETDYNDSVNITNLDFNDNKSTLISVINSDENSESPETLRRKKIKKLLNGTQTETVISTFHEKQQQHSRDSGFVDSSDDLLKDQRIAQQNEQFRLLQNSNKLIRQILIRNDSFNNASSDEETNLMMTKMRKFLRNMFRVQNSFRENRKPSQLVYFEDELTRLMKLVPGLKDEQVKEIVEYLSSEETWSDSCDSSSDLDANQPQSQVNEPQTVPNKDTSIVYQRLMKSFTNSNENMDSNPDVIITEIMEHIGSRLVALMNEVSHNNLSSNSQLDESNCNVAKPEPNLLRSKSHDLLLLEEKLGQSLENVEERETTSDYEQFSWRGSFESALLVTDSRVKLSNVSESTSPSSALVVTPKGRSAGDLLFNPKSSSSSEQLDRVRSCGSIGGDNKAWTKKTHLISNISINSDSEDSDVDLNLNLNLNLNLSVSNRNKVVSLPRNINQNVYISSKNIVTNSLPRLPTSTTSIVFQKAYSAHHVLQNNIKSTRYRPPGYSKNFSSITTNTTKALSTPRFYSISSNPIDNECEPIVEHTSSPKALEDDATSSPILENLTNSIIRRDTSTKTRSSLSSFDLQKVHDDDIVSFHKNKNSYSSLGLRSDSLTSIYSGNDENHYRNITVKGQVQFSLLFNYKTRNLEVNIKQCRDLAATDLKRNRSDPYIKVYLLPDKSKTGKRKTKVKKHTLNPIFNECIKFNLQLDQLQKRTLWLTVWHFDIFGRNTFLGEVRRPLENMVFDNPVPIWYILQETTESLEDNIQFRGDIIVGLKFIPSYALNPLRKGKKSKGELHILIKEAKCLLITKSISSCNPFCKSYLLPDKCKMSKQKTTVQKKTINPVWNQSLIYQNITLDELHSKSLELTIWNHDMLLSNEFLGGVKLSLGTDSTSCMDSNEKEINFWQSMLNKPNFWVECSLPLKQF